MNNENNSLDNFVKSWLQTALEETVRKIVREELDAFYEARFKNDNGSIQSVHNNIDELRNVRLKALQDSINQLNNNDNYFNQELQKLYAAISEISQSKSTWENIKGTVANIFQSNQDDVQRLREDLNKARQSDNEKARELEQAKADIKSLQVDKEKLSDELETKKSDLDKKISQLDETQTELSNLRTSSNAEIIRLQNENARINGELNKKESELKQTQQELSEKNSKLGETQSELSTARNNLNSLSSKLTSTEAELQNAITTSQETGKKLEAWKNSADIYSPVRDAMLKCPTFSSIVENYGLNDTSETGLLVYAQAMGRTTEEFVYDIWKAATEVKKLPMTRELMTLEEAEVYSALNKVYRQIWNIDFDIFTLPGGQSFSEPFQKTKFDSNNSIYLLEMRNKNLSFTTGVYVPILMNKENKLSQKAYVDAGNR